MGDRKTVIFIIALLLVSSMLFSASYTVSSMPAGAVTLQDAQAYFGSNNGANLLSVHDTEFLMGDGSLSDQGSISVDAIGDKGSIDYTNLAVLLSEPSIDMFNVSGSVTAVSFAVTISGLIPEMSFDVQAGHAN